MQISRWYCQTCRRGVTVVRDADLDLAEPACPRCHRAFDGPPLPIRQQHPVDALITFFWEGMGLTTGPDGTIGGRYDYRDREA
jgi:hypothetical protein